MDINRLKEEFNLIFGDSQEKIRVFEAPGRVNLIGEHIDYCGGTVLPVALSMKTTLLARKRSDGVIRLKATDLDFVVSTTLDEMRDLKGNLSWGDYPIGVAVELQEAGFSLSGCDLLYHDTVPHGCGLSSSAAVEVATALCLCALNGHEIDAIQLAKICQKAEHNFIGVKCGIMDQFASALGKAGHAIHINCDTLKYDYIPLPFEGYKIVIVNTHVKHSLSNSAYNERRASCEQGLAWLKTVIVDLETLAEIADEDLEEYKHVILDDIVYKRLKHVTSECERVSDSILALSTFKNLSWFGKLMYASHASLRDDYEVSCPELDLIVEESQKLPGVLGARMTGGGFGGCAIALVEDNAVDDFIKKIGNKFLITFGHDASFYIAEASDGCREIYI